MRTRFIGDDHKGDNLNFSPTESFSPGNWSPTLLATAVHIDVIFSGSRGEFLVVFTSKESPRSFSWTPNPNQNELEPKSLCQGEGTTTRLPAALQHNNAAYYKYEPTKYIPLYKPPSTAEARHRNDDPRAPVPNTHKVVIIAARGQ